MRGLFVFQRDLRLEDQVGLSQALLHCEELFLSAVIDPVLSKLNYNDSLSFNAKERLHAVANLESQAKSKGYEVICGISDTVDWILSLCECLQIKGVWLNAVYEPSYLKAYQKLQIALESRSIQLTICQDNLAIPFQLLHKKNKEPYKVFTPFYKLWRSQLSPVHLAAVQMDFEQTKFSLRSNETYNDNRFIVDGIAWYERLKKLTVGHEALQDSSPKALELLWTEFKSHKIKAYETDRDFPALAGTSCLSAAINNGQISFRRLVRETHEHIEGSCFLRQLAWRSFYQQILYEFPTVENSAFIEKYKTLVWDNNVERFEKWKAGQTGFDLIDAAMIQLKTEGNMPNRLRMLTASFLVKQLDVDWRWGEAYFYEMLRDGDLAANNGGWQWCASTGTDAQPYFRRFNPYIQAEKFDPQGTYRDKWLNQVEIINLRNGIEPCVDLKLSGLQVQMKYKKI